MTIVVPILSHFREIIPIAIHSPIPHSHSNFPDISISIPQLVFPLPAITIFGILKSREMCI